MSTFTTEFVFRQRKRQHIANLPENYHDVLDLTYIAGFSARDVGERLGYTEATVQKMLSEARRMMRPNVTDPKAMYRDRPL